MQRMSLSEQLAWVRERQAGRDALNVRLETLSRQRAGWIEEELRRTAGAGDSFDRAVSEMVNAQAQRVFR
jgi:hypothetical protein